MIDRTLRPENLTYKDVKPALEALPPPVASRIEDMWRAGGMLSDFVKCSFAARKRRELIGQAWGLGLIPPSRDEREALQKYHSQFQLILDSSSDLDRDKSNEEERINKYIGVNSEQGNRLSCEAELLFFHSAIELLPDADRRIVSEFPLLHCLKRLRNVMAHYRELGVNENDFKAKIVDDKDPTKVVVNLNFIGSWFIVIEIEDLLRTQGGATHGELFTWFKKICDTYPLWWILHVAVHQLCDYFAMKK